MPDNHDAENIQPASGSRRQFLKILGGGTILAAGAGTVFAMTRTPHKALEPWRLALGPQTEIDPRRIVLSHAILAPNPHNRQPWLVDLAGQNEIILYCDLDRRLPETDPYDRQITIGLGCFIELLDITAREIGMVADIDLFPEGEAFPRLDNRPVASIRLSNGEVERDPLFARIFDRRSNKEAFDQAKSVAPETVSAILSAKRRQTTLGAILEDSQIVRLRALAWDAMETELRTYRTSKESIDLMRIGKAEIEANPDGIDLGGAFFETMNMLGQMDREAMLDVNSNTFKQMVSAMRDPFDTAAGFVFVKTSGNSRKDQINAGRDYVRLNLKATELGVSMHPFSQSLQEFEEVKPFYREIRKELSVAGDETLQMFARIGYGEKPAPSPRWSYETRIRNA